MGGRSIPSSNSIKSCRQANDGIHQTVHSDDSVGVRGAMQARGKGVEGIGGIEVRGAHVVEYPLPSFDYD